MLPRITRRLIVPLHERLLGRATLRVARGFERSQWWSPAALREHQRRKLGNLLRHARERFPFWRERLGPAADDFESTDPLVGLERLPPLTKAEIRNSLDRLVWPDAPGGLHRSSTGGSSGESLIFYLDRRRQAFDQAARIRSHRWFDVDVGDRELYLWGSPIEQQRRHNAPCRGLQTSVRLRRRSWLSIDLSSYKPVCRRWRDRLFNHCLLDAFNMSAERMDLYLDAWDRFRPVCLFGYPSSIALFVEHAQARRRQLDGRSLRAVFVTGEVCYPHQRKVIEKYFRVPVADGYGSRDAGFIAHQCPEGGMHVTAESVIVETLDPAGRPVAPGETGEIVVTHLDAHAMPFIRYRTGDVGRRLPGRCACGRGLPLMDIVAGRTTDFLRLPDGTIRHALSIIYPLRDMEGLRQFRVTQERDFSVTVDAVADDARVRITREAVMRRVRPVLGDDISLRVEFVKRLDPSPSGKHRYVVSHAPPHGADVVETARAR